MKKLNLVCAAVVALCATAANAGTLSGTTTFAVENFSGTATSTTTATPGPVTYSMTTSTTLNAGSTIYFVIRLTGGQFAAGYTPSAAEFTFAGAAVEANAASDGDATPDISFLVSADKSTMQVKVINGTSSAFLGLGALVWTPAAGALDTVNATLATAGGAVGAQAVVLTTAMGATAASLNSTVALPTSLDAPTASANIAVSAAAISAAVSDLSDESYTNKIDLTTDPVGADYTTTGQMALGAVTFKTTAGRKNAGNTADYTLEAGSAGGAATAKIEVTPGSGEAFPVGSTLAYDVTSNACGATAGTLTAVTAANAANKQTLTIPAAAVTSGTPIYICMSSPGSGKTAAPMTATIVGTVLPAAAADGTTAKTGAGYPVVYNGKAVTLNSYFPAAISQFGYTPFVRIINTGAVTADISASIVNATTGALGTAGVVAPALKPGAAVLLTNSQIEAVIGAQPRDSRPRLKLSGPTNGLRVQNFLQNADGSIAELSGAQDGQ